MRDQATRYYRFGPFVLDATECALLRGADSVPLSPKTFEVLRVLVANSGRLVTKTELMSAVWPDSCVEEANLTVNVSLLRKALGETEDRRPYIETVPKRGYRFTANVARWPDLGPTLPLLDTEEPLAPQRRVPARVVAVLTAVVLLSFSVWGVLHVIWPRPGPRTAVHSLAVLPFRSLGVHSTDEYLGLGIADALITRLGSLRQVIVRPTSAVRKFNSFEQDSTTSGRQLGVDAVLEGSIQTLGPRLRVTVRLLGIPEGTLLWADKFEHDFTDLFAVEDSISQELATALALKLTREENRTLQKRATGNPAAYQLYLKGRYFWNRRTPEGIARARQCFEQAIQADPGYALAYAGLADSYLLIGSYGYSQLSPRESMPRAEAAAERALAIDDSLGEVHASLGYARLVYDWNWSEAARELRHAIDLNPLYATAYHWYSHGLTATGRFAESLENSRRALALDPVDVVLNEHLAWHYLMTRQYGEAVAQCRRTLEMDAAFLQAHRVLGLAQLYVGKDSQAIAQFQKALELSKHDPVFQALTARAYGAAGQKSEARNIVTHLEALSRERYVSSADIAAVYASLRETNHAFDWLEKAYQERSNALIYLQIDPGWDSLRGDPRFSALTRRIGLPSVPQPQSSRSLTRVIATM